MGRGLGKLLAQKGANVVIVARDERKLADAVKYIAVRNAPGMSAATPTHNLPRLQPRTRSRSASTPSAPT